MWSTVLSLIQGLILLLSITGNITLLSDQADTVLEIITVD